MSVQNKFRSINIFRSNMEQNSISAFVGSLFNFLQNRSEREGESGLDPAQNVIPRFDMRASAEVIQEFFPKWVRLRGEGNVLIFQEAPNCGGLGIIAKAIEVWVGGEATIVGCQNFESTNQIM